MSSREFLLKDTSTSFRWNEKITVNPFEIAVDRFISHDRFDAIDGRTMAFRGEPCRFCAVKRLQLKVAIIERVGQVGRRPRGFTTARRSIVNHDDVLPLLGEAIRRT